MLLCKGKNCRYKKTCRRYVLGQGVTQYDGCGDTWIDHCLNAKKFEKAAIEQGQSQTGLSSAEREQARHEGVKYIPIKDSK